MEIDLRLLEGTARGQAQGRATLERRLREPACHRQIRYLERDPALDGVGGEVPIALTFQSEAGGAQMERLQLDPLRRGRLQPDANIDRPPDQGLHLRRQDLRRHVQAAVDPDARQIGEPELEVGRKAREVLCLECEPPAPVGERPLAAEIQMQLAGLRALRDSREQATRLVRLEAEIERSAREIGIERKPCVRRRLIDTVDAEVRGEPVRGLVGPCMAIDPEGGGLSDHRLPQLEPIDKDPQHVDRHRQGFRKLGQAREREWLWRLSRRCRGR